MTNPLRLGVNIDHVATVRQARRANEPDPVWAAALAETKPETASEVHAAADQVSPAAFQARK